MTPQLRSGARQIIVERTVRAIRWISLQESPFDADEFATGVGVSGRVARRYLVTLEAAKLVEREGPSNGRALWRPRARLVWS